MFGASLRATRVTVDRAPIDPVTGQPGGTASFPSASGRGFEQPIAWPPGPGGFLGVGAGVARRFALAIATYTPFSQKLSFDVTTPTRYHLVSVDSRSSRWCAGWHRSDGFAAGRCCPGLLFSYGHLVFDETQHSALRRRTPQRRRRYDLATDGTQAPSYFVVGGIHYRRGAWEAGLAYASAPLGSDGRSSWPWNAEVTPPSSTATSDLCSTIGPRPCVSGEMRYTCPISSRQG